MRVLVGLRVVDDDRRALEVEHRATSSAGASRTSSELGLNAAPSAATRFPSSCAADELPGEVDRARTAAQVDLVHLVEERDGLTDAEFFGAGPEGTDVLRQAATAEAETGLQEAAPDPVIEAERRGEQVHVRPRRLADLGHRVDVRDLRREERVGSDLHEFGRGGVSHDEWRALVEDRRERAPQGLLRPRATRRRTRGDRGGGCPPPRTPRAGTRGSRRARVRSPIGETDCTISVSRAAVPIGTVDLPTSSTLRVMRAASSVKAEST